MDLFLDVAMLYAGLSDLGFELPRQQLDEDDMLETSSPACPRCFVASSCQTTHASLGRASVSDLAAKECQVS